MSLTKTNTGSSQLRRTEIRSVLKRHKGSIAEIAREVGVTTVSVSMVLRGKGQSERILNACQAKARELLSQENKAA